MLTPDSMILGRDIKLPDDSPEEEEFSDNWMKRQRYVHKCKEASWKRWVHEYLAALRERYNLSQKEKPVKININDVIMIKGDEKNRGKWKIGIIENIFMGKGAYIKYVGGGPGRFYKSFKKNFVAQETIDLNISWPSNFFKKYFMAPPINCSSLFKAYL